MNKFEIVTHSGETLKLTQDTVQRYLTPDANITEQEFMFFFQLCKAQRLNPFLKEAYIIKYGNQPATIVVDYKVLQQIAERSQVLDGIEQGVVVENANGDIVERQGQILGSNDKLLGGWCKVYRSDKKNAILCNS